MEKILSRIFKIAIAISIIAIIAITVYPPVYNCTGFDVPENVIDDIRALSSGMYKPFYPRFPYKVTVDYYNEVEEKAYFTIYYFPATGTLTKTGTWLNWTDNVPIQSYRPR